MSLDQESTRTGSDQLLIRLGAACVASGVLGVVVGVVTLAYPDAVPDDRWSYPFPYAVGLAFGVLLAVTHALTLAGFVGVRLADPHRGSRAASIGLSVAISGYTLL